uniref:DUF834 domain-containing protein n=1 Tax=Oryza glumipatula TaxID=40148 RepID=A0A0E0AZS5_9ORYZ
MVRDDGGRRLWRTATRLKDREAPRDYEEVLGGGGHRWRGDELPRRSAAAMVAAVLRSRGGGRRGTRLAAGVGFAQGLQRGCRGSQREPGAVGLALSLRASALAGGGGIGLATAAAVVGAWARQGIGRDGVGFVQPWHSGIRGQRVAQGRVASLLGQRERGRAREQQLRVGRAGERHDEGSGRASGRGAPALPQLCQRESRAEVDWSAWKR